MPTPPLPDENIARCRLVLQDASGQFAGTRFYLAFGHFTPAPSDLQAVGTLIQTAWVAHIQHLTYVNLTLKQIVVDDITTLTGAQGVVNPNLAGTLTGNVMPISVTANVAYHIARRYRGGKPRGYWPIGTGSHLQDQSNWTSSFLGTAQTDIPGFFAQIEASPPTGFITLAHVSLSYYGKSSSNPAGFTNVTDQFGRTEAVPAYKPVATHDVVTGYTVETMVATQKRRLKSTTP